MIPIKGEDLKLECDCKVADSLYHNKIYHHHSCGLVQHKDKIYLNGNRVNLYFRH